MDATLPRNGEESAGDGVEKTTRKAAIAAWWWLGACRFGPEDEGSVRLVLTANDGDSIAQSARRMEKMNVPMIAKLKARETK